ncbi:MAG: phytanoyl-CoA dioxygenase family protein [Polyangiaceae bacterium]|nr:phytanoyl-CoA dioxygenase family protein [Polyangiaceae bacterium]
MSLLLSEADDVDVDDVVARYREHGYAKIGPVIAPEFLARLRARADDLMLGRRRVDGLFFQHDAASGRYEDLPYGEGYVGPSLGYRKIEKLERDDLFRALLENPLFERIVRRVLSGGVTLYRAVLFSKAPGSSSPLPWHQDAGRFWGLDRDPEIQIWTAIDDASSDAGCLEVIEGSHKRGLVTPLGGVVQPEHVARERADERATKVPAKAGEVVVLHNLLWHRSGRNQSPNPRRGFTVCYMNAETRCLRTKRAPRAFVPVFDGAK